MSNTNPTHLPLALPQSYPYHVGTLHLIGCDSESQSVAPPPTYETATASIDNDSVKERIHAPIGDMGLHLKVLQSDAIGPTSSKPIVKWDSLITACEEGKAKLEASLVDLNQNWLKIQLLKEEKALIQQQLEAGLAQIQVVHEAAQALCDKDTQTNLLVLEAALKGLEAVKPAVSTSHASPSPSIPIQNERVNRWQRVIQNYLGPIALTGWGLIVQSGILSSDTAKRIPLVGGIIGLCLKIKDSIDTCIEQAKTEDQAGLIAVCESLVETFMNADRIGKAVQETLAARRNAEESLEFIKTARKEQASNFETFGANLEKLNVVADKFNSKKFEVATLESRLTKLEESMELLISLVQKQSHAQPSTNQHTRVENPA